MTARIVFALSLTLVSASSFAGGISRCDLPKGGFCYVQNVLVDRDANCSCPTYKGAKYGKVLKGYNLEQEALFGACVLRMEKITTDYPTIRSECSPSAN